MHVKKAFQMLAGSLLVSGLLLAQGPRRGVGENVPLPPAPPGAPRTPDGPIERGPGTVTVDVNLVSVDVVVTDKNGMPLRGLDKQSFKIFDENVEQPITNFTTNEETPLTVVVVLEFAQSFGFYYDDVVAPAANFVRTLRPDDWAALVTYDLKPTILTDFTKDKEVLVGELSRLRFPDTRETALYDAVFETLKRLEKVDGKKALFLLSTGLNTFSQHSLNDVLKVAESSDTMIYAAGLGQFARLYYQSQIGAMDNIEFLSADNNIRGMAEASGGAAFYPRFAAEYSGIYERISRGLRSQYSIGFVPRNLKTDGKFHKLKVEVAKMDTDRDGKLDTLTARHKKGYYAPKN